MRFRFPWLFSFGLFTWREGNAFYYQIPTPHLKINKVVVGDLPFVVYGHNQTYLGLPDECAHMGASLARGWVEGGSIVCPYHGIKFRGKELYRHKRDVFVSTLASDENLLPYYPPEEEDRSFVSTGGRVLINNNQQIVTENVLDMLHISYVHSFGRNAELPTDVFFEELSPTSGRSTFLYRPFEWTISNRIGKTQQVIVENEYHLPTTTITRVIAGDLVKTVMTRATPVGSDQTLFFYRVYRNFWIHTHFPFLTCIGDRIMDLLMWRTIQEDVNILKHVYPNRGKGFMNPFDVTIKKYRESLLKYHSKNLPSCGDEREN